MPEPGLRASDDDRDSVLHVLQRHFAAGRLTSGEFDQRSTTALAAITQADLAALTADLPELTAEPAPSAEPTSHGRHLAVIFLIAFGTLALLTIVLLLQP